MGKHMYVWLASCCAITAVVVHSICDIQRCGHGVWTLAGFAPVIPAQGFCGAHQHRPCYCWRLGHGPPVAPLPVAHPLLLC